MGRKSNKNKETGVTADNIVVTNITGLAMHTQPLSPSLFSSQPLLRGADLDHHRNFQGRGEERGEHNNLQNRLAEDTYQANASTAVSTEMAMQSTVTSVKHSAEIQVTTKEGDIITISLNEGVSRSRSEFQAQQGNSEINISNKSYASESGFSMSIEGNLNEDEQKSLTELIDKMTKVSDKFFAGNINAAFKHAQKIGFDTDQIAGFSLDLSKEKSIQAVAAYQQTTVPEQNINTDLLKQAGDFLAQTKVFMADAAALLDALAEPKQAFTDLFAGIGQMNFAAQEEREDSREPLFLKMIENIGNDIL